MTNEKPILKVDNLKVSFKSGKNVVKAVNGVTFELKQGESLGIVGESGSGKSVTATSILGLLPSRVGKIDNGSIYYKDKDLTKLSNRAMRKIRGNEISMIFQDPMSSLNPVYTIGDQIMEGIRLHQKVGKKEAREKAIMLMRSVGIPEPEKRIDDYPHEFSGGMQQRVMITMALSCNPNLLIADEPTTALDVTVQAQILSLLKQIQRDYNTAIIMITHDLGVVWESCENVLVMYAGHMVEYTSAEKLNTNPLHPYTWGLLDSIIMSDHDKEKYLKPIEGSPPELDKEIKGCPFVDRCVYAVSMCSTIKPELKEIEPNHIVACHLQENKKRLVREGDNSGRTNTFG